MSKEGYLQLKMRDLNEEADKIREEFEDIKKQIRHFVEKYGEQSEFMKAFNDIQEYKKHLAKIVADVVRVEFQKNLDDILREIIEVQNKTRTDVGNITKQMTKRYHKQLLVYVERLLGEIMLQRRDATLFLGLLLEKGIVTRDEMQRMEQKSIRTVKQLKEAIHKTFDLSQVEFKMDD